jgi:hypothetical protein
MIWFENLLRAAEQPRRGKPLVITMCFPCRSIQKPAFCNALWHSGASHPAAGPSLNLDLNFADRDCRMRSLIAAKYSLMA